MKWFAACGGLQLGMAQIVGCLDRLQSAFWSCRGQTLVSPPVLASLPAPTPLNKLDWRLGQYFLPVWRNTHENCRKTFLSFLKSIYSIKFEEVWVWKCVCVCACMCVWVAAEECEARLVSPSRKDLIWTWLLSFIGWRWGCFIGCYLWSSLFTWWVARNGEETPHSRKKKKRKIQGHGH